MLTETEGENTAVLRHPDDRKNGNGHSSALRVGIIGYGYWGPNIVRNFHNTPGSAVAKVCDRDPAMLERVAKTYPAIPTTRDSDEVLCSPDIDVVGIVTPVSTHYPLAKKALENGKHVFVEKPFTTSVAQAEDLIELADKKNLKIMVDHTFLFTGAVRKIRELIDDNQLGDLYYYDSVRVNLGMFQYDTNVVWDLAPHDLSIMDYLIGRQPSAVVATGERHVNGVEDVAYITVYFPDNVIAHFNVNWLSPVKVRTTLIGGEKKMLMWNDLEADEKIKIYDKGVERKTRQGVFDVLVSYRTGDMWAPRVKQIEALRAETEYFVECVQSDTTPFNDGVAGLRVVKILEAVDKSLRSRGGIAYL